MTPALKLCAAHGVAVVVHRFHHDPQNTHYGEEAVQALGVPAGQVFKTLMVGAGDAFALAVLPVNTSLDLKALAQEMGVKRVALVEPKIAAARSGYLLGGMSPLAHKKPAPLFLDQHAAQYATIFVSAGQRGMDLEIAPADLLALSGGRYAALAHQV